jgi:hypothetical protein
MNLTGGFTGQMSPDAVKAGINAVMYERYGREEQPSYLSASDPFWFKQDTTDEVAFVWDEDSNVGEFEETGEQEEIQNTDSFIGNTKTKFSQKYTKQIPVSDEAFRADKVGKRNQIGKNVGDRARQTQDKKAILTTYGDAFSGSFNTTPDAANFASNSHVTLKGVTVDNLETGNLTPDNLWTCTVSLANQKSQDGDAGSQVFQGLLLPFLLYKTGKEVMNSTLLANGGENNVNIFDTDYGEVRIKASIFLGSTFNSASNANTSYHLISENHMVTRKVFYGLTSNLIPPEQTANDTYAMRSKFHEATFPGSWTGYVGSNGSANS